MGDFILSRATPGLDQVLRLLTPKPIDIGWFLLKGPMTLLRLWNRSAGLRKVRHGHPLASDLK